MKKKILTLLSILCISLGTQAQEGTHHITGTIIEAESGETLQEIFVYLRNTDFSALSNATGDFKLNNVPDGDYVLVIKSDVTDDIEQNISVNGANVALGMVKIELPEGNTTMSAEDIIPIITLNETDIQSQGSQSVSGLLSASRDVFINTAAFTFGTYQFKIRGYDSYNMDVYMNGILMNDLETGSTYWSAWGGLNDVMRNRTSVIGLETNEYGIGGVGGAINIDNRASNQWDQLRVSYASSNRTYTGRLMATYSTGMQPKGWALSFSASRRWAQEGYVEGTSYDAWSYFMAIEKKITERNSLNLTVLGAPLRRGKSGVAVEEANDLAGSNYYNPNWGYQNGEKRNARMAHSHQPIIILTDEWTINERSSFIASAGYQFGSNGATALNWYNAPDPRPDYYRNLPSFITDSTLQNEAENAFLSDVDGMMQLNWDQLYNANNISSSTIENYNGTGRDTVVNLARYMIEDRRIDKKKVGANLVYQNQITSFFNLRAGVNYTWQRTYNYKLVDDLLGADVFVDLNQFAERDFVNDPVAIQNDIQNPNRLLKEGDRFGYDYNLTVCRKGGFLQTSFALDQFDFFATADISHTRFFRTGNVQNGLFPDNSLGDSEKKSYLNYGVKAGITYKINGRNYLFANGGYMTRAPFAQEAFVSPQTRNQLIDGLTSEKIRSFEGGYLLKSPRIKARAVFYFTQFLDGVETYSLYYDVVRNFINISLSNIDKQHMGAELAAEVQLYKGFSVSAVAALGQHIYTSRQFATFTVDNSAEVIFEDQTIYSNNFRVENGPQIATTLGINYRAPKWWYAGINFNYFDHIYIDFAEIRRTADAVDLVDPSSQLWNDILNQEELKGQFTMDFFGGASWRLRDTFRNLKRSYSIYLTVGVNNITNNTNFRTGGFEQSRVNVQDRTDLDRFPARYFYAYGTNFFVNLTFRM